jgi:hypothetical protein
VVLTNALLFLRTFAKRKRKSETAIADTMLGIFLAVVNMSHIRHAIATPLPVMACFPASTGWLCRRKMDLHFLLRHNHKIVTSLFLQKLCGTWIVKLEKLLRHNQPAT